MSNYTDFIIDFPKRCHDLLESFYRQAAKNKLEVTFMLAIAASGFLFAFERGQENHPLEDSCENQEAKKKLKKLLDENIEKSPLWEYLQEWQFKKLETTGDIPSGWPDSLGIMDKVKNLKFYLTILRNALAHGNIKTSSEYECINGKRIGIIKDIVFISEIRDDKNKNHAGWKAISLTPIQFYNFLVEWFKLLSESKISQEMIFKELTDAA